jgi:hypothetical protein
VYGLPEVHGDKIPAAKLIANPGCYPQTAILGLAPLVANGLIELSGIVIDSKSGVSGAGRTPKLSHHFPECNESVAAYSVGSHRHTPEIEQGLSDIAGKPVSVIFTPHLMPMDRGILSTIYATPTRPVTEPELLELYRGYFADKPFVRVRTSPPATKDTVHTNFLDVYVKPVRGNRVVVIAARTTSSAGPAAWRCRTSTACSASTSGRGCFSGRPAGTTASRYEGTHASGVVARRAGFRRCTTEVHGETREGRAAGEARRAGAEAARRAGAGRAQRR